MSSLSGRCLVVAVSAIVLAGYARATRAESGDEADAGAVAASVQAFYDQTKDVSATFFQTYVNKLYKRTDRSSGQVVFKKPGLMRWDYAKPNGKVIVSNGKRLIAYEPGEDGDKGQVVEQSISEAQLPQALSFLMGTGKLSASFTFRLLDAKREGFPNGDVLELKPKLPTPHYDRVLFYVERSPALRGVVRRVVIIDANGNRNRFDFTTLKFNSGVTGKPFEWQAPKEARRVQM